VFVEICEKADAPRIAGAEVEPGPAGQARARILDIVDKMRFIGIVIKHPAFTGGAI
jgi:hypothetical protein